MPRNLAPLFFPRSVAVIGASPRADSLAGAVLRNLVAGGFAGPLAAVHPSETAFDAVPVYASVDALPDPPDLAVWGIPAPRLAETLPRLLARGTRAHVVISAGFSETGEEGKALEAELARGCRDAGGVLLGPNCMGIHVSRPGRRLDAGFSRVRPDPGGTVLLSQSGSIAEWILLRLAERGLGAALAVSLGNMADLDVPDLLEGIAGHFPETRHVLLYLETIPDADRLRAAVAALPSGCRLLVLRGGRTEGGRRAVAGHTGALAAEPALAAALLAAVGARETVSLVDAVDALEACDRLPPPRPPVRAAVITNAGGPAVLAADALGGEISLPPFSDALRARLAALLPPGGIAANPVDALATASPATLGALLAAIDASGEADALLPVFMHPVVVDASQAAEAIRDAVDPRRRPTAIAWMAGPETEDARRTLRAAGFPVYPEPTRAARALAAWASMSSRREPIWPGGPPLPWPSAAPRLGAGIWGDPEVLENMLAGGPLRIPARERAGDADGARAAARRIGFPVVIKIESPIDPHKADAGLLAFVADDAALEPALARLGGSFPPGGRWLIQAQVSPGPEVYAGYLRHPRLGPFVSVGRGGSGIERGDAPGWLSLPAPLPLARAFARGPALPEELRRAGEAGVTAAAALLERLAALHGAAEVVMAEINPAIWDREREVMWIVDCRWEGRPRPR